MNPFTLLVVLGIGSWSLLGIIWFIGSFIFVGSLALVTVRKTYHAIRAAIRKNQPERRDEPSLTPKRGGSECRPVAHLFTITEALRPSALLAKARGIGLRQSPVVVPPRGLGTGGNKPLMRNRMGHACPPAIGTTASNNFLRKCLRFNPTLLAVGLVVLCGCGKPQPIPIQIPTPDLRPAVDRLVKATAESHYAAGMNNALEFHMAVRSGTAVEQAWIEMEQRKTSDMRKLNPIP